MDWHLGWWIEPTRHKEPSNSETLPLKMDCQEISFLPLKKIIHGGLWIGTNNGLSLFDGKNFLEFFTASTGLKSKFIFSLEATKDHSSMDWRSQNPHPNNH